MAISIASARRAALAGAAIGILAFAAAPASAQPDEPRQYNQKREDLETALHDIALASGRPILAPSSLVAGRQGPALKGRYTAQAAVQTLLAGTGLKVSVVGENLVVTDPAGEAQDSGARPSGTQVAEVVVTASHIKGAPPAAPVEIITRGDIERSGYGEIGDLMRSLPQAYGGGSNPGVLSGASATSPGNTNQTDGSSVNLRGLGSDATLVLLNGHRVANDAQLAGVDISVIPLAAIDHVDVITDGASAVYGADAVAGVANFVMRSRFDGAEVDERLGGATGGGGFTQAYTGLAGKTWQGGGALASVEYLTQDPILASQRGFTAGAPGVNSLIQEETQTSAYANLSQDLAPWASVHLDGLYGQRRTGDLDQVSIGGLVYAVGVADQSYFIAPSLALTLPGGWSGQVQGSASGNWDATVDHYLGQALVSDLHNASDDIEASANGPVFNLPGGPVKLAVGGGYRDERYGETYSDTELNGARGVTYGFGELFVPLVSPGNGSFLLKGLDLSLAGRWERYSDFGATANPKVGLRYQPTDDVTVRATWGTSFKAPDFYQEATPALLYLYPAASLGGTASGAALLRFGGGNTLRPETANAWTAGADWSPRQARPLKISLTYFHIDFSNRIVVPITGVGAALSNPAYAPFVVANPTSVQQAAAIQSAFQVYNLTGAAYSPSSVTALVNDGYTNAAAQKIDGVDLSIKDSITLTPTDTLDVFADASWLHIVQQSLPGGPQETLTGTLFNPPTFRIRSGLTWSHGPVSAGGFVNDISGETDNGVTPNIAVSSWTTVDLNLSYAFGRLSAWLPDLKASLSVTNLFNAPPPYAKGASVEAPGYNFDSTNASAIGRFVALTLRERL